MSINIPATSLGLEHICTIHSCLYFDSYEINLHECTRVWGKTVKQAFVYMFLVPAEKEFEIWFLFV